MTPAPPGRWADLRPRVLSGAVMVAVGALAIWDGGAVFAALVLVVCAGMIWELSCMTRPGARDAVSGLLALVAALSLLVVFSFDAPWLLVLLVLPSVLGALVARRIRAVFAAYAFGVMLTGHGLVTLRDGHGLAVIVWVVLVVAASDLMGYFAGRIVGGPKFWPRISPKKTWSGTVAGWIGAVLVGLGFVLAGQGGWGLVVLSPLVALAGQMGDIAESWIKRHAGVKDSSGLIPGHGGVMDRFDALAAAVVLVYLLSAFMMLPIGGR